MSFSLLKLSQISGRPSQNATPVAITTKTRTIQNIARGNWKPKTSSVPDRFHRIAANDTTETTARTAPNSKVFAVPLDGMFGVPPAPAVKMSMSCWMRWSGLSMVLSMNRSR